MSGQPNVIVLTIDALRPDYLDANLAPEIQQLIGSGVYFENAFSTINATEPSLTSFYTGNCPRTTGLIRHGGNVTGSEIRALGSATFLQERLSGRGYSTVGVDWLGDWHERGYDHYSGELKDSTDAADGGRDNGSPLTGIGVGQLLNRLSRSVPPSVTSLVRRAKYAVSEPTVEGRGWLPDPAEAVVNHALEQVEQTDPPFYLFCHFWDTHSPYELPDERLEGFDESDPVDRYRAAISYVDDEIARLRHRLEELGYEDTLFVVMGDHGESFGEHGIYFDHHGLYDQSLHVPLILSHPNLPNGRKVDKFVQHVDLAPTILEFIADHGNQSVEEDGTMDGESLLPVIKNPETTTREAIVAEEAHTQRRICLRTSRYKYIELVSGSPVCRGCNVIHGDEQELYDLKQDPEETNNIVDQKPEVAGRLQERVKEWMQTHANERHEIDRAIAELVEEGDLLIA